MVLGSDARQEFEACIWVFNGVNFWCTQTSASLNNPIILQNKENMSENEMQHGILQHCKQNRSQIPQPDRIAAYLQILKVKRDTYLQTLKYMKINQEKKKDGSAFRWKKNFFFFLQLNMFTLLPQVLKHVPSNLKCNTSDRLKWNTILVVLTGRHQLKQILPGNMDGLFFGRLRWMGSKFLKFLWNLALISFPMSNSGGRLLRLDDL